MSEKFKHLTKKQHAVYDKIVLYIEMSGVSPTLEELRQMLSLNTLNSVKQYLDALEKHGLIKRKPHQKRNIELITPNTYAERGTIILPVIASAGCDAQTVFAEQSFDEYITIDKSFLPKYHEPDAFVLFRAIGDSMNAASIESGDYVLAEKTQDVHTGDRVVAVVDGMAIIKRLRRTSTATILEPDSTDPRYKQIIMRDDSNIFGKVIDIIKIREEDDIVIEKISFDTYNEDIVKS